MRTPLKVTSLASPFYPLYRAPSKGPKEPGIVLRLRGRYRKASLRAYARLEYSRSKIRFRIDSSLGKGERGRLRGYEDRTNPFY